MSEWQPIETAPKDGTKIDLLYPHPRLRQIDMYWEAEGPLRENWCGRTPTWENGQILPESKWNIMTLPGMRPSHWMPVPAAPKATAHD